jgi:hypothetical protein
MPNSTYFGDDLDQGQVLHAIAPHKQWFGGELLGPGYDPRNSSSSNPSADQIAALKAACPARAQIIDQPSRAG